MRTRIILALFLAATLSGCGKSSSKPTAPQQQLPNDPNTAPPPITVTTHFSPDTQWVEISPTTDDVEVRVEKLAFQYAPGLAWRIMYTQFNGGPVVARFHTATIEALNPWKGHDINDAILDLNLRRSEYRTWFSAVRVLGPSP
jgi:hypothetical protein